MPNFSSILSSLYIFGGILKIPVFFWFFKFQFLYTFIFFVRIK